MANVEGLRAGIALANENSSESIAALQQAGQKLEEAKRALAAAAQGSPQAEIEHSQGMLEEATRSINAAQEAINASVTSNQTYVGRL